MSIDFSWEQGQSTLKRSILNFARQELNDNLAAHDKDGRFPRAAWDKCAAFGLLGLPIPEEYGGRGVDPLTVVLALEALGQGCRDNGLVFVINNHIWSCAISILNFGTEEQKRRYLPAMCCGEIIGGQVLTEPATGSDAFNMQVTAVRSGDHYLLNGTKTFITNAPIGDIFIVYTRTDPDAGPEQGVTALIVKKEFAGFTVDKTWDKMGLRSSPMGQIVFRDCKVPADHVLGGEGRGYSVFQSTIEWERGFFFASQVGTMARLLDQCVQYARERKQFGQSIGSFQLVSEKIVAMKTRLELARLLIYKIGWLKRQGRVAFLEASIAKLFISEGLVQTCLDAIQIHGARGYMTEYEIERELRDAVAGTIYAGTSEIQRGIIAGLLGL